MQTLKHSKKRSNQIFWSLSISTLTGGPCKIIAPSIDRLAEEYNGTVKFVKLNIDQSPDIARKYDVKSIPTMMIFRSGKSLRRMIGASSINHYRCELQKVVSKNQSRQ